jgi:hypothetical protein
LPHFVIFILRTPFYIVKTFLKLLIKYLTSLVRLTLSAWSLGLSFTLSALSTLWVVRLPRYRARRLDDEGDLRRLCDKCRHIVDRSNLLRGTYWGFTRSREMYPFQSQGELQESAKTCHLCSLLWKESLQNESTSTPTSCSADYDHHPMCASSVTEPLLTATTQPTSQERVRENMKSKMEISAIKPFRREQSLHIRLLQGGSDPLVSLTLEDTERKL